MDEMLSVAQAAAHLGLNRRTVQRRLERGDMLGLRVHPKLWLVPRSEVEIWKTRGKLRPGPKPARQLAEK